MANRIDITTLQDGPRFNVTHVYIQSDGAAGDLDSYELAAPAEGRFTIESIRWAFTGFSAKLHFEILVDDTLIWVIPESSGNYIDFREIGGLKDRSATDGTGRILISTTGLATVGDEGSIILKLKKAS